MSTFVTEIACVASVSMQFRSNENEEQESNKQSKTARKMAQVKEWGGVRKKAPSPPPLSFFGSRFISHAVTTELNRNACYAGYD